MRGNEKVAAAGLATGIGLLIGVGGYLYYKQQVMQPIKEALEDVNGVKNELGYMKENVLPYFNDDLKQQVNTTSALVDQAHAKVHGAVMLCMKFKDNPRDTETGKMLADTISSAKDLVNNASNALASLATTTAHLAKTQMTSSQALTFAMANSNGWTKEKEEIFKAAGACYRAAGATREAVGKLDKALDTVISNFEG